MGPVGAAGQPEGQGGHFVGPPLKLESGPAPGFVAQGQVVEPVGHVRRSAPTEGGVLEKFLDCCPGVWLEAWAREAGILLVEL